MDCVKYVFPEQVPLSELARRAVCVPVAVDSAARVGGWGNVDADLFHAVNTVDGDPVRMRGCPVTTAVRKAYNCFETYKICFCFAKT